MKYHYKEMIELCIRAISLKESLIRLNDNANENWYYINQVKDELYKVDKQIKELSNLI